MLSTRNVVGAASRLPVLFVVALSITAALALGVSSDGVFSDRVMPRKGGTIGVTGLGLEAMPADDPLRRDWEAFLGSQDGRWTVALDARSGLPTLVQGRGLAWAPGAGNDLAGPDPTIDDLAARAEEYLGSHALLLGDCPAFSSKSLGQFI